MAGYDQTAIESVAGEEGARIVELGAYRGVALDGLDMSSLSPSGTFKDWVACLAISELLSTGQSVFLAQSSGNTANALALYADRANVAGVVFVPRASRRKVHSYRRARVTLVEVDAPEVEIKQRLAALSSQFGIPVVPSLPTQYAGNALRARFYAEAAADAGYSWDWHAQALSSGYGPFGFYRGLSDLGIAPPKFLGIQQEGVAPYWTAITHGVAQSVPLIEPTLFRASLPASFISRMVQIVGSGGTVKRVLNEAYLTREEDAVERLDRADLSVTRLADGSIRERAGLLALVGTQIGVDEGLIEAGTRVLVALTGGLKHAVSEGDPEPALSGRGSDMAYMLEHALLQNGSRTGTHATPVDPT